MPTRREGVTVPLSADAADRQIAAEIAALGPALPGTILARSMRCRSPGCHCHADPPHLHGPYWFWTRKVEAKTVSRVLSAEQVDEYRSWSDTDRRLRALVRENSNRSLSPPSKPTLGPPTAPRPTCAPPARLCKTRECSGLNPRDDPL